MYSTVDWLKAQQLNNWPQWIVLLVPCSFILPLKISNILIVLLILTWLFLTIRHKAFTANRLFKNQGAIGLLSYFSLFIVSLLYTDNLNAGFKLIETKLSFLLFPIVFCLGYDLMQHVQVRRVLIWFAHGIFLAAAITIIKAVLLSESLQGAWDNYTFEKLSRLIDVHPGYFSLYACFSILIFFDDLKNKTLKYKVIAAFEIGVLLLLVFRLASRMPLIALIVSLIVLALYERKFKTLFVSLLLIIVTFFFFTSQNNDLRERYYTPLTLIVSGNFDDLKAYVFNRVHIYSCSLDILSGPVLLTGLGAGDAKDGLMDCYKVNDYWWVLSQQYNAHNEFFQTTIEVGILGCLLLITLLQLPFRFWRINKIFTLFVILFGLFSLTESTLQVQKGVVFFTYFYTLFTCFITNYTFETK